jgi:hypothetical protein
MPPHRRGGIAALRQLAQHVTCRTALVPGAAPVSTPIASAAGRTTRSILRRAGLFPDVLHHRQRAISTGADHQPATSPGDVLGGRERSVPVRAAEPPGRGLLALADLSAVDDQVVIAGHAVDPHRTG